METPRNSDNYDISIHALHEESDHHECSDRSGTGGISIHALHEESDILSDRNDMYLIFQSTLSMRRATTTIRHKTKRRNFNPRSP